MNSAANPKMLEMIEMPPGLVEQTREQQRQAPYYGLGFSKARLDPALHQRLADQLRACASRFIAEHEIPEIDNNDPNTIPALYFEDHDFNQAISQALQPLHEQWSGMKLIESACYGFRVYQRGTFLHSHVDRTQTHHISSTICVDARLNSRWPLFIEDIDGGQHQIDTAPGELIFYEGAKLKHGRPYPLDGDYYAALFVHYRPQS